MHLAVLSGGAVAAPRASSSRSAEIFTSDWPDAALDALRTEGDEAWDGLWRAMDRRTFQDLLRLDLRNDEPLPAGLPADVVRFFDETGRLPPWADLERVRRAQALFSRHGLPIVTVLLCASLPECYAAVKGASILGLSTNLQAAPERRIMQTAQFVLDVMAPGGLEAAGRGVRRAQQVRLLHVVCRHGFLRHAGYRPEWGLPLNQEDMLGTLMSFSSIVIDALPKLGIDLTEEEQEDYLHCWQIVGHLLGVRADQLPGSAASARRLCQRIRERHFGTSPAANPAGAALAGALARSLQEKLPFEVLDGYVAVLVRHLSGDGVADALGIERADWTRVVLGAGRAVARVGDLLGDTSVVYRAAAQWLGRRVLEVTHHLAVDGQPQHFSVPEELERGWGLQPARPAQTTPSA